MTPPVRLFLLRHGEVEDPYQRAFGGRIDMNLSPRGHQQAAQLAAHLRRRPIDLIYASPMKRAQQTLEPLKSHGAQAAVTVADFREVDFGDWTGLTWEQVHARYDIHAHQWLEIMDKAAMPNGESTETFRARIEPEFRRIISQHAGESVAIVCHGGVIRMMLAILLELPMSKMACFEIDYASVTLVERHQQKTEVALLNFTPWRDLA